MIKLKGINKTFNKGTPNEVNALRDISIHIQKGEFISVIGTNGSGKSTLLNAISGSIIADSGIIEIAGRDVTKKSDFFRAQYISRVFQNPFTGTAPVMTIGENLHMAYMRDKKCYPVLGNNKKQKMYYYQRVKELEMQLEDRLDTVISTLSGGQRQAVTLLMAVITRPEVLLLDEHTAALDPKSAAQVLKLTNRFIEQENLTAFMVTHSMQQALDFGGRTIMMHKGRIIDDITAGEKKMLTVNDLLEKFAELRRNEQLTEDVLEKLRREYV